jgi:hypothetical protein
MSKLFVYGDSWVYAYNEDRAWTNQLAKSLNLTCVVRGFPGLGILQTFELWQHDTIQPGDQIVIVLTSPDRSYFFKELPWFSQLVNATVKNDYRFDNVDPAVSQKIKNVKNTFIDYHVSLHNPEHIIWFIKCWMFWLDNQSKELGTQTIIIPAFNECLTALDQQWDNLLIMPTALGPVSLNEVNSEKYQETFFGSLDPRANHLTFSNHVILVEKIINALSNKKFLNSDLGWVSKNIIKENLILKDWCYDNFSLAKFDDKNFFNYNKLDEVIQQLIKI